MSRDTGRTLIAIAAEDVVDQYPTGDGSQFVVLQTLDGYVRYGGAVGWMPGGQGWIDAHRRASVVRRLYPTKRKRERKEI